MMTSKLFSGPIQDDIELLNLMVDSEKNADIGVQSQQGPFEKLREPVYQILGAIKTPVPLPTVITH
jgi:hypothetical protein